MWRRSHLAVVIPACARINDGSFIFNRNHVFFGILGCVELDRKRSNKMFGRAKPTSAPSSSFIKGAWRGDDKHHQGFNP